MRAAFALIALVSGAGLAWATGLYLFRFTYARPALEQGEVLLQVGWKLEQDGPESVLEDVRDAEEVGYRLSDVPKPRHMGDAT